MKDPLFKRPDPAPCVDCPYRRDAPSGLWAAVEYDKLPAYDKPFPYQPQAAFACHKRTTALCAGWVGCHGADNLLALKVIPFHGVITPDEWAATLDYTPDPRVPLFSSGKAAAEHGKRDIDHPDLKARVRAARLLQMPAPIKPREYG
jgi:hypothetical protein